MEQWKSGLNGCKAFDQQYTKLRSVHLGQDEQGFFHYAFRLFYAQSGRINAEILGWDAAYLMWRFRERKRLLIFQAARETEAPCNNDRYQKWIIS